jgi:hypothetical protein
MWEKVNVFAYVCGGEREREKREEQRYFSVGVRRFISVIHSRQMMYNI